MPWVSEKQRGWIFATHPAMARRWAAEEKAAPSFGPAKDYTSLLSGGLIGISDNVLREHVQLYQRYCAELAMLDGERQARPWTAPPTIAAPDLFVLLSTPVRALDIEEISGPLLEAIQQVEGELQDKGISWRPLWYVGDSDFWTADHANSINLPWFLATDRLWQLVNGNYLRYSRDDVVRILRHETGHALGYAYEIWKDSRWKVTFGDMNVPYQDDFVADPARAADFVTNIADNVSAPLSHYAQKHPDEDWAETFAVWLDEGSRWRETYADRPVALAKLEAVQDLIAHQGAAYGPTYGPPPNRRVGRRVSFRTLDFTVGDYLGVRQSPDPAEALLPRTSEVYSAAALHELYFDGLRRGAGAFPAASSSRFLELASLVGGFDAWTADFRSAARAASGWVLAVWDRRAQRIRNVVVAGQAEGVPPNADVLVALDLHEHAYVADDGARKDVYVGAWWRNVDWTVVEARTMAAAPRARLPQLWGVLYANPNSNGERKACGNCRFADDILLAHAAAKGRPTNACMAVAAPINAEMVCGYHVERPKRVPADLAGLEVIPGGTSCGGCRFFTPAGAKLGRCGAVEGPDGQPAIVAALGCCARWEPGVPVPGLEVAMPTAVQPVAVAEVAVAAAAPAESAIANAIILPTSNESQ